MQSISIFSAQNWSVHRSERELEVNGKTSFDERLQSEKLVSHLQS